MITREEGEAIAAAAKGWLGTKHVNGARVKGSGIDCGMLLLAAVEDAQMIPRGEVDPEPYSNEWHLHHSEEWFLSYIQKYCSPVDELQPGDFLVYQYGRCVSHGAVYCGNGVVCHALIDQGVVLTDINDVMFLDARGKSRLRGIYRYNGGA